MKIINPFHATSLGRVHPESGFGDLGEGGIVVGQLGIQMVGTLTDGQVWVYDAGTGTLIPGDVSVPITVEDEGIPLATAADTLNFVGAGVTATGSGGTKTITIPSGGGGTGTPGWFNVKDAAYGAVGDGTTDDTASINLAIAALNAAGKGVLYFPAGTYKCTAALTTITAAGLVLGDGMGGYDGQSSPASLITCTSQTAVLFTVTNEALTFRGLAIQNTYGGTPSAGAGIYVTSANIGQKVDFDGVAVRGFYDNIDIAVGAQWEMRNSYIAGPVRYGIRIRNTVNADAGDWSITDSWVYAFTYNGTSAIRIESAGGAKLVNVKINGGGGANFVTGIDVAIPNAIFTGILQVTNCSIENVSADGIKVVTAGTGQFPLVAIVANEFFTGTTGHAVTITANTLGEIYSVVIGANLFRATGSNSGAAISLTKVDQAYIFDNQVESTFASQLAQSGCTNIHDHTGGIAAGVDITGTPSVGDVPIATSATAAAWTAGSGLGPTKGTPATSYGTPAAGSATTYIGTGATIAKPTAADVDFSADVTNNNATTGHHGLLPKLDGNAAHYVDGTGALSTPAGIAPTEAQIYGVGGHWELLMDPATSSPPVPLTTPDGTDWVYGWVSDGG